MKTGRLRFILASYFTCTRSEKNAAILLSIVLLILQGVYWYRNYYHIRRVYISTAHEEAALRELTDSYKASSQKTTGRPLRLQPFDPNEIDSSGFVQLGMSPRQASAMIRFRKTSGGFRDKGEVRRARVLSQKLYQQWEPWMVFKSSSKTMIRTLKPDSLLIGKKVKRQYIVLDLNRADTMDLNDLPLIGAGRARAIVNYRERLGGFHSLEQLLEIRAIPDSVFEVISGCLVIRSGIYRKIDLNHLPVDSLRHPYLPKQLARMIVSYRDQHGVYANIEELRKLPLADDEIIRKLAPYLIFNP